jgi:hypothetical protein
MHMCIGLHYYYYTLINYDNLMIKLHLKLLEIE